MEFFELQDKVRNFFELKSELKRIRKEEVGHRAFVEEFNEVCADLYSYKECFTVNANKFVNECVENLNFANQDYWKLSSDLKNEAVSNYGAVRQFYKAYAVCDDRSILLVDLKYMLFGNEKINPATGVSDSANVQLLPAIGNMSNTPCFLNVETGEYTEKALYNACWECIKDKMKQLENSDTTTEERE